MTLREYALILIFGLMATAQSWAMELAQGQYRPLLEGIEALQIDNPSKEDVLAGKLDSHFKAQTSPIPDSSKQHHWFRLRLHNPSQAYVARIAFTDLGAASLTIYQPDDKGTWKSVEFGLRHPETPGGGRLYSTTFEMPANSTQHLYIEVNRLLPYRLTGFVGDRDAIVHQLESSANLPVAVIATLFALALFILCIGAIYHEVRMAMQASLLLSCAAIVRLFQYRLEPSWFHQLPLSMPTLQLVALCGALTLFLQIPRELLDTRKNMPWIDRWLKFWQWPIWLFPVATLFTDDAWPFSATIFIAMGCAIPSMLLAGALAIKRGTRNGKVYTLYLSIFIFTAPTTTLASYNLLPANHPWVYELIVIGYISLSILFVFALASRRRDLLEAAKQAELVARTMEAEKRAQGEFFAFMSHEIRTPLNGVMGMAELLQDTPLSPLQQQYTRAILGSGTTLLTTINDILDFTKIERGHLQLERIPFDLDQLLDELVLPYQLLGQQQVALISSIAPTTPLRVIGDPTRLRQVLGNLLSNAFKFTREGHISLRVSLNNLHGQDVLEFCVEDTGIGIAAEALPELFTPFKQAELSTNRRFGGSGLGLAICKMLVNQMGGDIKAESTIGQGSMFSFWIKAEPSPITQTNINVKAHASSLPILLIDDNASYLAILKEQLAALGFTSLSASSAVETKAILASKVKLQAVLVDLHLQDGSGLDLAREIGMMYPRLPIMLLTASTSPPERALLDEAHVSKAAIKPSSIRRMAALLDELLATCPEPHEIAPNTGAKHAGLSAEEPLSRADIPLHVLVVDDFRVNLQVMEAMLNRLGASCKGANSGPEAIELLANERFDLIFMDCEMPEMDGYETCQHIRAQEHSMGLPATIIIAFSGHTGEDYVAKSMAAGMSSHVSKPVTIQKLRQVLERVSVRQARPAAVTS